MSNKIKIGIIGVGNMGTAHLNNIYQGNIDGIEAVAVCDIKEDRRRYVCENFKGIEVFENATDMYKSGLIDSVLIATPHYDHPSLAIEAFDHDLNVLTEKPIGVYTKQVNEMIERAKKSDKVFAIMYNQRTNPVYIKLRDLIKSGELGNIKRVNWTITDWYRSQAYHDSSLWRSTWKNEGGGALINQNPHQLDLWQWLFGMPSKIMAHVGFGKYHNIEVEDDVTAYMKYENGMTGTYITSTGEAPGTNRLEIACDMGRVVVENNRLIFNRNKISEREFEKINTSPFGAPEYWNCEIPVDTSGGSQHTGVLKAFADCILNGGDLIAKGEEGINGLTISNAIHYSAWTNQWADINNFPHDEFYNLLQEKIKNSTVVKNSNEVVADVKGTF